MVHITEALVAFEIKKKYIYPCGRFMYLNSLKLEFIMQMEYNI